MSVVGVSVCVCMCIAPTRKSTYCNQSTNTQSYTHSLTHMNTNTFQFSHIGRKISNKFNTTITVILFLTRWHMCMCVCVWISMNIFVRVKCVHVSDDFQWLCFSCFFSLSHSFIHRTSVTQSIFRIQYSTHLSLTHSPFRHTKGPHENNKICIDRMEWNEMK